ATATPAARRNRASPAPYDPVPSTPTRATSPNPDSHRCSSRCPAEVVGNSATPSSPPIPSSAAATFMSRCVSTPPVTRRGAALRSRWLSTPPVTGRAASTMVTVIPSASEVLRDGAAAQQRGGGAIALLAQGDPPHYGPCWRHISPGPAGGSFPRQAKPSADSRAKPEPKRGRQYTSYRSQGGGLSPIIPLSTTPCDHDRS